MIKQKLTDLLASLPLVTKELVHLEHPANPEFGDYSTNIAMVLFGKLEPEQKQEIEINSPRDLAEFFCKKIEAKIEADAHLNKYIQEISTAGSGFINFKLSTNFLKQSLKMIAAQSEFYRSSWGEGKTWAIEHTSPNPNKAMHLGHLRNNVTAMAISNLWEAAGVSVIREAVDNNRGIAIAKLMWGYLKFAHQDTDQKDIDKLTDINYWFDHQQEWLTPQQAGERPDRFVDKLYVKASQDYRSDPAVKDQVKQMVIAWEEGDKKIWALWEQVLHYSYQGQQLTLDRLGNQWDKVWHEHEHYRLGKDFVQKGLEQGIFKQLEDGAVLTDLDEYQLPNTILQKSDGTSLYITQDIALMHLKKQEHQADRLFWVVGPEQNLALRQMFAVCDQLGIADYESLEHLDYGYMSIKGQGKMSSRAGNVVFIDDLIDEAKQQVNQKMKKEGLSESEIGLLLEQISVGAVKYSILKVGRQTDMAFDFETALCIDGNSGPYLQYTHARAKSVLQKAEQSGFNLKQQVQDWQELKLNQQEQKILRHLYQFPEQVLIAAKTHEPSLLATFLYQTAQLFNSFYNKHQILVDDEVVRGFRLTLTKAVKQILSSGLDLLGIAAPDKM